MLDMVAALEWVRDNIEAFGGDPNRVLVYGSSGGAGKTSTLLAMPSAKGLFHRANLMSGAAMTVAPADLAAQTAERLLGRLGIKRSEEHTSELQSLMRNSYAVICLKKKNKN